MSLIYDIGAAQLIAGYSRKFWVVFTHWNLKRNIATHFIDRMAMLLCIHLTLYNYTLKCFKKSNIFIFYIFAITVNISYVLIIFTFCFNSEQWKIWILKKKKIILYH